MPKPHSPGSAVPKTLKEKSGHVLSVDFDRDWVASEIREWLESHVTRA
jgi:esterase/lipase